MHYNSTSALPPPTIGVCYPVQSRTRPRRHLLAYLLPVIVFAVAMNVPRAFELNVVSYWDGETNETLLSVAGREWANSEIYTHYYKVWSNLIVTTVVPLIVLVVCNVGIFVTLRRSRRTIRRSAANGAPFGSSYGSANAALPPVTTASAPLDTAAKAGGGGGGGGLSNNPDGGGGNTIAVAAGLAQQHQQQQQQQQQHQQHRNDHGLALILICIVLVFVLCHSLRFFLAFYQASTFFYFA